MATTATVTVGSDTYTVYSLTANAVTDADSYWNLRLEAEATTWAAASTDDKSKALAMAADMIDRMTSFTGEETTPGQDREWPRDNATDNCTGEDVADGSIPDEIANAEFHLAGMILTDSTIASSAGQGNLIKRVKAGSAEVEYFRNSLGTDLDTPLPQVPWTLVKCFTDATTSISGPTTLGAKEADASESCGDLTDGYS
jgi:hypothetical protein